APRLTLRVLAPEAFAWERATLVTMDGGPALEALRLVRPEWYSDRTQGLAVFSWEEAPVEAVLARRDGWLGGTWVAAVGRPAAVGFVTEGVDRTPEWPEELSRGSREVPWFGADVPTG